MQCFIFSKNFEIQSQDLQSVAKYFAEIQKIKQKTLISAFAQVLIVIAKNYFFQRRLKTSLSPTNFEISFAFPNFLRSKVLSRSVTHEATRIQSL